MNNSDKKITELPLASALTPDDVFAVVQNGVTSQVNLRTIFSHLNLAIPQARIKVARDFDHINNGHDQVYASWEGSDINFLEFNPQFWLYRYRKADVAKVGKGPTRRRKKVNFKAEGETQEIGYESRKKRFVHPSHMHGGGKGETLRGLDGRRFTNYYKGEQVLIIEGEKVYLPGRQTEWDVDKLPYRETALTLEPWKYFKIQGQTGAETLNPKDFPTERQPIPKGAHSSNARMVVFKVRIAIDNPDRESRQPKLFGPFSETFIFFPHRLKGEFVSLKCYLGEEASPMLRKRFKTAST